MTTDRTCTGCGAPLRADEPQPLCPACIFGRLADTGSTVHPPESDLTGADGPPSGDHDTDFYAEYELLGEIGRGGMGVIYKAHQATLNRVVALKVIHAASHSGEVARRRFHAEVNLAAQLNHPNIVPVYDVGVMDKCPCYSMEYFPGGSLAQRLAREAIPIEEGVALLIEVARAVFFAHQRGVLHRDLKPANILLDAEGEPHVADFGLAKELDSDNALTRSGAVLGTPTYMSPEQAAGRSDLTVATDIYSLGTILYELLTRRPPFQASTPVETLRLTAEHEVTRPGALNRHVDRDLDTICLKCLEKDPAHRFATANDLAADLERWRRNEPIQARPITSKERFLKWVRRRPTLAGMSALLVLTFLAGLAGVLWQWRRADTARRDATHQLQRAESALARSAVSLAESALREGNGPAARAALGTVPGELRDGTWHYLLGESDTSRPLPDLGLERIDDLAAHPAQPSTFAAVGRSGRVVLVDVRDGVRRLEFQTEFAIPATNAAFCLAFDATGTRLAVGRSRKGGVVVHDTSDGRERVELTTPAAARLEFSPDGKALLLTGPVRRELELWDLATGERRWRLADEYCSARFTHDGRHLATHTWSAGLRLVTAEDGHGTVTNLAGPYLDRISTQPGGSLVVAANGLGLIRGFDATDGRVSFELQPFSSAVENVAFLPGGDRFLTAATLPDGRQALQCWDARNGHLVQTLNGGEGPIRRLSLHPLSGELVIIGSQSRVWSTASVPPVRIIRGANAHPSAVFWGTDETLFGPGTGPDPFSAQLLSIADSRPALKWKPPTSDHGQPSVSADGRKAIIGRYNSAHPFVVLEWKDNQARKVATVSPPCIMAYLRLSPSGDRVAVTAHDFSQAFLVDVATGKPRPPLDLTHIHRVNDLAWLDAGRRLAGLVTTHAPRSKPSSIEEIVLWDAASGRRVHAVTNDSLASVACAAPDGARVAEGGADRSVRIRDAGTLAILRQFRAHNAPLTAMAWHPTRPILATASDDLVIRLWNIETGARLEELRGPLSPPTVLSFSPGGTRLATAARDGIARVWEPQSLATAPPKP